jgi:hypothetical protein
MQLLFERSSLQDGLCFDSRTGANKRTYDGFCGIVMCRRDLDEAPGMAAEHGDGIQPRGSAASARSMSVSYLICSLMLSTQFP